MKNKKFEHQTVSANSVPSEYDSAGIRTFLPRKICTLFNGFVITIQAEVIDNNISNEQHPWKMKTKSLTNIAVQYIQ